MKKLPLLVFLVIITFASCKKSVPESTSLNGKWLSVASFTGIGSADTKWMTIPLNERTILTLHENGTVSGDKVYANYTITDERILIFKSADHTEYETFYTVNNNELTLNSTRCIEGCAIKYKRIE